MAAQSVLTGARVIRDPVGSVGRTRAAGRSLRRELTGVRHSGSDLLAGRGPRRAFDALEFPTPQLRAAGAAAGGHIGDVTLAATVDGLARYHAALGAPVGELTVGVPLRLRFDGSGDRLPRTRITVPTTAMSPGERIALMERLVSAAERLPHVDVLRATAPLVSRTPTPVMGRVMERAMRPLAAQGFVVPGLGREAYLAGAKILRMFSFAPTSGCALSMTLVIDAEMSCLGFNLDTAAITHPDTLGACLRAAFAAVLG